jgi:type VI secretion system protein ImpL
MLRTLLSIITSRLLWGFVGITAICVIVWTVGPLVSIGDYRPLESEFNRFAAVLVLYLVKLSPGAAPLAFLAEPPIGQKN